MLHSVGIIGIFADGFRKCQIVGLSGASNVFAVEEEPVVVTFLRPWATKDVKFSVS
jgi:hypothetical protein